MIGVEQIDEAHKKVDIIFFRHNQQTFEFIATRVFLIRQQDFLRSLLWIPIVSELGGVGGFFRLLRWEDIHPVRNFRLHRGIETVRIEFCTTSLKGNLEMDINETVTKESTSKIGSEH